MTSTATLAMDRMYRHQRHIYDLSRSCYLVGRNHLIADLAPTNNATVLEIGCGTGRNLIRIARSYPGVRCYGIDASSAMLSTADASIARAAMASRIIVANGDAVRFDPLVLFGRPAFDRVVLSFVVSMVPQWQDAVAGALNVVMPGGSLHIVDFGTGEGLPRPASAGLRRWLRLFNTVPRDDLVDRLRDQAAERGARLRIRQMFGGYAQYAVVTLPGGDAHGGRSMAC